MKKFWNWLKKKWKIEDDVRMTKIFIVFAITGSATMVVRKQVYTLLGIDISQPVLAFIVKMVMIYIVYQIMLYVIGLIFGERQFFTWFLKKMNYRMVGKKVE